MVERYIGKYYSAIDASDDIDINTINAGCDLIDETANDFIACSKKVKEAGQQFTQNILCFDGSEAVEKNIVLCANEIQNIKANINIITAKIRSDALQAYNERQRALNDAAFRMDQEKIAEEENKS